MEVDGDRPRRLPQHPPPPQRQDDGAQPVLHGPPPQRAALVELAHGQGAPRRRRQGLPDRDHAQQRRVRHVGSDVGPAEARVGVERPRPRHVRRDQGRARSPADAQSPQDLPVVEGTAPGHLGAGWRGRSRPRADVGEGPRAAPRPGRGADRHPHDGPALHRPVQRELDHEPDPRHVPGPRVLLQPVPGPPARARGRRAHHEPPDAVGVPPGAPPELHRLLRAGARRLDRPQGDRAEVRGAVRQRRVVPPPVPDLVRLPRRPPVLHVVLGRARARPPRPGHRRRG